MANFLHPDKLVGVARATQAIQARPTSPRPSAEQAAMRAASKPAKGLTPQKKNADSGLMEQLAFRLRDAHWADHMDRLARRVDSAVASNKPAKAAPKKAPAIKPLPLAPVQPQPVVMLTIGANPPKVNA